MWNIEVVRTYKAVGVYECEDKVIFEVNSLDEASEIVSMFDKYSIGEYRYSINRKKESEEEQMALKSYEELIKIDVSQYCEDRDGFTYLNWAKCIELLRKNGATEVYWEPIPDSQTGSSLRKTDIEFTDKNGNTNRCYETRIKVVIDDKEYEMQTPVMNGANPVKDNSMSQQRVWNSMCRAFVKCVAIHTGLGFNLWLKEEYNKLEAKIPGTGENLASEAKKKTLKTQCTAHGIDLAAWVCGNGKTMDTLTETECAKMLNAIKKKYGDD